jgi:hypothetical protein
MIGNDHRVGLGMATFRIWFVGTKDFAIEEGSSEWEACRKAGLDSQECRVQRIPDDVIVQDA